ncbi:MAG: hypothetical protein GYA33_16335 [Thermogutta sp.]|nr:hypothetical protein [Thermogutta sp.]
MTAGELLDKLIAGGFGVRTDGERLFITPKALLTADLRSEIQSHKAEVIAVLTVLSLAEQLGWPELELFRDSTVPAGEDGWRSYLPRRPADEIALAKTILEIRLRDKAERVPSVQ